MAEAGVSRAAAGGARRGGGGRLLSRVAVVFGAWVACEALARSGLLYHGVVPSSLLVLRALGDLLHDPEFYQSLSITLWEIGIGVLIGATTGWIAGIGLGTSRFLAKAYEPWLYYLGPTPKIIILPLLIMLCGAGAGSKIAMGALSCFFPVALSIATGMREVDRTLVNVGRSFCLTPLQLLRFIYLPSSVGPTITGLRLGFGVAVIGILLSETKVSRTGVGFLVIQAYERFDIPRMYALLIIIFGASALVNILLGTIGDRLSRK
ncbi:MAG TPA: ABC transporter permease subunit [Pseudolabrys sp.]|nr:ABC transporter permease subunit [Pseudolabrys sp.]